MVLDLPGTATPTVHPQHQSNSCILQVIGSPDKKFHWESNWENKVRVVHVFTSNIRMQEKCQVSDFDRGIVVDARWAGLSISEHFNFLGFSSMTVSKLYTERCEKQNKTRSREQQFCRNAS